MDSEMSSSQLNSFVSQSSVCDISGEGKEEITDDTDSAIHFSGIGEDVPYMSATAMSRACSLKYESDCFSLEDIFTNEDYKNLTPEQVVVSLIPLVEKYDINSLWYVFKTVVEKRMASIPFERLVLETEWLKDPTVRLAKILCFLPIKKMPSFMLGHLHMSDQECIFLDSMQGYIDIDPPSSLTIESGKNDQSSNSGHDISNLLLKIEELQHKTANLINENTLVQELLSENGKKLKIASEENLHLKHQLLRAKIELKEIDDLTTEVWSLRAKIASYKRSEKKKREKLKEIEEQNDILLKRVLDIEGKVDHWHAVVDEAKNELIAMKNLVCSHEKKIILAVHETTMTQIQLDEVNHIKSELEISVKELLDANEALRSDKRILENNLAEMKFLLSKNDGVELLENLNCENIFCEDDSFVAEDEVVLNTGDSYNYVSEEERVSTDLQKSIEVNSGSTLLQKSLAGSEDNAKVCHSSDVQDQINAEIRALREQLVRSQVLFSYLLKDGSTDHTSKSLDCKTHLRTLLEEGNLGDVIYQCKSFDGQVPARFYNRSNRSSSSYASHRSTPMHCGYTSLSCPTLPIESPVVTKSTQTEPMSGVTFYMRTGTNGVCSATSSNSLSKGNVFFSPPSTPCETAFEPLVLTDVCEVHHEPDDHSFPRHRTNSFLSAVKEGNPKLIDATSEFSEKMKELDGSLNYMERKLDQMPNYTEDGKTEFFVSASISKASDSEVKHLIEENKSENAATEKKPLAEKQGSSVTATAGPVKTESYEKSENNKEKFKTSQRSMRRGSGAGSPNSQLSIPRYPAFDFGEQEDAQSLFPSPSEPEANRNIKAEILQGMKISEVPSDGDTNQNGSKSLKEISQKKKDSSKSKTLMPELMENSETESAKGSFECEAPDLPTSVDAPPVPVTDIAFPSLPNTFLAKLGVHKDSPLSVEAFDEQELESKFIALSLAFKTDRTTLSKRLELHKRQRDMAEKNVENEFQAMRDHLNALNLKASRPDVRELIAKIQNHLDIAQQATARVSGRSETYGAVQQEERVSRAFEVLVLHVDHLKRLFDKEHKELEETRRILTDTQAFRKEGIESVSEDQKKYMRSFGLPVGSIKSDARQRTLCPFPTASSVGLSSSSLPTSQVTFLPPSRISTVNISARRCSLPVDSPLDPNTLQNLEATSNNSNLTVQPFPFPDKHKKKEKNFWTRKLSSVSDEKEQDDEESDHVHDDKTLSHNTSDTFISYRAVTSVTEKHSSVTNKILGSSDSYSDQFDADDESLESDFDDEGNTPNATLMQALLNSSLQDIFTHIQRFISEERDRYHSTEIHLRENWACYSCIIVIFSLLFTVLYLYFY